MIEKYLNYRYLLILILLILSTFIILNYNHRHSKFVKNYMEEYWEQCDVEFCGVVLNKKTIERGFGYVCLDLKYANKPNGYKLYINNETFVCAIRNDKILFVTEVAQLKIGDSICYNINKSRDEERYRNNLKYVTFENAYNIPTDANFTHKGFECN